MLQEIRFDPNERIIDAAETYFEEKEKSICKHGEGWLCWWIVWILNEYETNVIFLVIKY